VRPWSFIILLASFGGGCTLRGIATSAPPRIFREVHGLRVRSYQITPVTEDLRSYRAIEFQQLENLMLDQIPESSLKQLNAGIAKRLLSLKGFERPTEIVESQGTQERTSDPHPNAGESAPRAMLVVEGYIDDYTPGIPMLRYIEQGNNHAVLTVRIILRDKQTARVLGVKNITVENTRITSNVGRMVEKTATEVAAFVDRSTTRHNEAKEVASDVQ
jgi:hypothetical protein